MKEYIEKETARAELIINDELYAADIVEAIPAADVRPVVRGKWLESNNGPMQKCSVCGATGWDVFYFCPNCGAKMDGGADDE